MLTYHEDQAVKDEALAQLRAHREADEIVQSFGYWKRANGGFKGCAVGCLTHDSNGGHGQYPVRWGIPEWLAYLEDRIFEALPAEEAKLWPERFMEAIPIGVEITRELADRLSVARLREVVLPLAPGWPESVRDQTTSAIEQVIVALEEGDDDAARSAAWSAESAAESAARSAAGSAAGAAAEAAARSAARSAAESAAWSAESAARSAAESAAWSAESAAWSAAWSAAREICAPVVPPLQQSALELLDRLVAVGSEVAA
jgi:hypothetical protein